MVISIIATQSSHHQDAVVSVRYEYLPPNINISTPDIDRPIIGEVHVSLHIKPQSGEPTLGFMGKKQAQHLLLASCTYLHAGYVQDRNPDSKPSPSEAWWGLAGDCL